MLLVTIAVCCYAPSHAMTIRDPAQLSANAVVIDLEDVDTGGNLLTSLPNPASFGGVSFFSLTGSLSVFDITISGWAADGTEVASKTLFPGGEPDSAIAVTFATPVSEVLIGWGDPNFPGNGLRAYDADGTLLEEALVEIGQPGGGHATWIGFKRSTADIARVIIQPDQSLPSGDDYVIDNIHFNTAIPDDDNDSVSDAEDICPGTVIPDNVEAEYLRVNHFALTNQDFVFDTRSPNGRGSNETYTLTDTAGCSCAQIVEALALGTGHVKFGCSPGAMKEWIRLLRR
jgi:hypothetical protein